MKNIMVELEYDGSVYFGSQRQPDAVTVQGEIEKALYKILGEKVNMVFSGRTDRGVHAIKQVANFFTETKIPIERLAKIINGKLSGNILIKQAKLMPADFHSRFSAKKRSYIYKIKKRSEFTVFEHNHITFIGDKDIDIEKLQNILNPLVGRYNFNRFRKSDCGANSPIREIFEIKVNKNGNVVEVYIEANSFLKSMVRIIMGVALNIYFEKLDKDYIVESLENPNGEKKKYIAPPNGLYLYDVRY
ncbi:tRNA pseudouridine(38-40) synthase TruA [Haliovirga abyssi]|uniref:tRNA pseudouridine synthase A n=1 Tax=Haliovirga abyssi TaxID=2996794 RepID=A0AAU9DVD3_9FUSO|nr:tRNA pseudouridine(38-40) synthase TruA [Haliovirga abyssi]BDU51354.1 tRNA pseudouridine synthase A [Haliovirga abyssi]